MDKVVATAAEAVADVRGTRVNGPYIGIGVGQGLTLLLER